MAAVWPPAKLSSKIWLLVLSGYICSLILATKPSDVVLSLDANGGVSKHLSTTDTTQVAKVLDSDEAPTTDPAPMAQTCYLGGKIGHAWMDLPTKSGACNTDLYYPTKSGAVVQRAKPDDPNGAQTELLAGCGFSSPFSSTEQTGWATGTNVGGSHSSGNSTAAAIFSALPGVRTGSVHGSWTDCGAPEQWALVPEICVRAVINEVAPEFSKHRQWTWAAAARWVTDSQEFRKISPEACDSQKGLKTRKNIIQGSWGGLYKDDEVCWDYILAIKSLTCRAKVPAKKVPYAAVCMFTAAEWEAESPANKLTALMEVRKEAGDDFFAPWATDMLDEEARARARAREPETTRY